MNLEKNATISTRILFLLFEVTEVHRKQDYNFPVNQDLLETLLLLVSG